MEPRDGREAAAGARQVDVKSHEAGINNEASIIALFDTNEEAMIV